MIDLTGYSDDELSLRVMNDVYFYIEIDPNPDDQSYLLALCREEFHFTNKQREVLLEDIRNFDNDRRGEV